MAASVPATLPAVGARAAAPSASPPRYPGGNGHLSLLRSHRRRLLCGLRCAALHLLHALPPRPGGALGGGCGCGPGRGITFRRTYSAASWKSWERKACTAASPAAPPTRSAAACTPSRRAAQTARNGGRALSVVCQRVGLGVSSQVVLDEAGSSVALVHPGKSHVLVCGLGGSAEALESPSKEYAAEAAGWGPRWTARRSGSGGLAVRLAQGQRLVPLQVAHHLLEARALAEAVGPKRLHLFNSYCAATSPAARSTPLRSARAHRS